MGDTQLSLEEANAMMDKWEAEEKAKAAAAAPEAKKKKTKKDAIKEGVKAIGSRGRFSQLDELEKEGY
jgi:P2-related tail formation protein